MEKSKIKTSFDMSLDNGWATNFIEHEDGSKTIEIGTEGFYPIQIRFGYDAVRDMRWAEVFDATIDPEVPHMTTRWQA